MLRILRILNRLNVGGPTLNVAYLSKYIDKQYQTKVIAGIKEEHEGSSAYVLEDLGLSFEYVPDMYRSISLAKDYKAFKFIRKTITDYGPDIVHTHAAKAGVLGRLAAYHNSRRPKVILHTYHGNVFDGYFSPLKTKVFLAIERYLAKKSTAIIAISDRQKNDLVNKYRIAPAHKVHVIRLGFDLKRFTENIEKKRQNFRVYYSIPEDITVITITGRLTAIKNHSLLIESLKLLREKHAKLKFKLFIVGDGDLYDAIILQLNNYGFSCCKPGENNFMADVIFTSWRKDIDVINAGSDIIALTSLNEGTPVSIIEAMASARGVISTDVGGVKDVIQNGFNGFVCDQTPEDISKKLYELIVNIDFRNMMAVNGQKFVMENYSYKRLIKETEDLYNLLLI
jgi:glycosyltransferase involved in cell wall biosynthesis